MSDGYLGPVTVCATDRQIEATARLGGHVEPVDGRFHWSGRLAPDERLVAMLREGTSTVELQVVGGTPAAARLTEVDPWGGVRVRAVGRPPWPLDEDVL